MLYDFFLPKNSFFFQICEFSLPMTALFIKCLFPTHSHISLKRNATYQKKRKLYCFDLGINKTKTNKRGDYNKKSIHSCGQWNLVSSAEESEQKWLFEILETVTLVMNWGALPLQSLYLIDLFIFSLKILN